MEFNRLHGRNNQPLSTRAKTGEAQPIVDKIYLKNRMLLRLNRLVLNVKGRLFGGKGG